MSEQIELVSGSKVVEVSRVSVKHAFVYAVAVGVIAIVVGIFFKSILLSVGLPAIVMGIYIWFVNHDAPDLPKSVVGDSFYYLGFVLTLFSLVVSLMSLSLQNTVNMNTIIGSFGAALITTIIGLIARLYATAFSVETKQRRERLEDELERSISRFTRQVDILSMEATNSVTKVHEETSSALTETLGEYQAITKSISDVFNTTIASGSEALGKSLSSLSNKINSIEIDKETITEPLDVALSGFISVIEKNKVSYHSINNEFIESNRLMSKQLSQSNSIISKHVSEFELALTQVIDNKSKDYERNLEEIANAILGSLGEITDVKILIEKEASEELGKLVKSVSQINEQTNSLQNSIVIVAKEFNGMAGIAKESTEHLRYSAENMSEVTSAFNSSLNFSFELSESMKEFDKTIKSLQEQLSEIVLSGGSASKTMQSAAAVTEKASLQVASDISKVYGHLASQIKSLREI